MINLVQDMLLVEHILIANKDMLLIKIFKFVKLIQK